MRRFRRRTSSFHRPKVHTTWANFLINQTGAFTSATFDVLAEWRGANNFNLQLPDITIWRFIFKISIIYTARATVGSNDGMSVTAFVDSVAAGGGLTDPVVTSGTASYTEPWLIWDNLFCSDFIQAGGNDGATGTILYNKYDVRSKRRVTNQNETLLVRLDTQGNLTMGATSQVTLMGRALLKLPGRG